MPLVQNAILMHAPMPPFGIRPAPPVLVHPAPPVLAHPVPAAATVHSIGTVMHPIGGMATVNPALLHMIEPRLAPPPHQAGTARTSFHLPVMVSPDRTPTDRTRFEDPQDGMKFFHLVRYGLATQLAGAGAAKWVSLEPKAGGFQLVVHLAEIVDSPPAAGDASSPPTRYLLTATQHGSIQSWDLVEAGTDSGKLKLTLDLAAISDRDAVYRAMTDPLAQARLVVRRSLAVAILSETENGRGWTQSQVSVDTGIDFGFDKQLDASVFQFLSGPGATASGWNIAGVNWQGKRYAYYQDAGAPDRIYYLPDFFRIGRQPHIPRVPTITVAVQGSDPASLTMTLSFVAYPVWDTARLADAQAKLQTQLGLGSPPTLGMFAAADAKLLLSLPADGGAPGLAAQPGALVDTTSGVQAAVTLSLAQFQQVYAALFDSISNLLSGEVRVTVNGATEIVPFSARAADFVGPAFDVASKVDTASGRVTCRLENALESPVHVEGLIGMILRGGAAVPNATEQISPSLPADLPPADPTAVPPVLPGALTVSLQAMPGEALTDSCLAEFDYSQTTVTPDAKAILRAIMQNKVLSPVTRTVSLRLLPAVLTAPAPPPAAGAAPQALPQDAILAVQAVFEGGQTASFDNSLAADASGFLVQSVVLATPMEDFVLGQASGNTYRYRLDLVTPGGIHPGAWVSDTRDKLFLSVD